MKKKFIILVIKFFLTIFLLYLCLDKISIDKLNQILASVDLKNLNIFIFLIFLIPLVISYRLKIVSNLLEVAIPLKNIISYSYSCHFINQIIPIPSFGDLVKIFYLKKYTNLKKTTQIILSDRLVGMLGLAVTAIFFLLLILAISLLQTDSRTNNNLIILLLFIFFVVLFFFSFMPFLINKYNFKFKLNYIDFFAEIFRIVFYIFFKEKFLKILVLSSILICIDLVSIYLIMKLLNINIIFYVFLYAPIIIFFSLFPITFAGWGTREYLFLFFLSPYQVDMSDVLILSLIFGLFLSIGSFPGLIFIIRNFFKYKSIS